MERIAIIGGGGHAKEVIAAALSSNRCVSGIYDDNVSLAGKKLLGVEVLGTIGESERDVGKTFDSAIVAIGDNRTRQKLVESLNLSWATIIHPQAWVYDPTDVGEGTVIFAGAIVQPDCQIGRHSIINTSTSVSHDCTIADYVHLAPGVRLTGGVRVEEGAMMGVASSVIPSCQVGAWTIVGAGSVVTRDLPSSVVAFGTPARIHRNFSGNN